MAVIMRNRPPEGQHRFDGSFCQDCGTGFDLGGKHLHMPCTVLFRCGGDLMAEWNAQITARMKSEK